MRERKWNWIVGMTISAACLWYVASTVEFDQIAITLESINYLFIIPVVIIHVLSLIIRAWRWRLLLEPLAPIRTMSLLSATSIGFMANMILPARAGEVIRAYIIGEREKVGTGASLAIVVAERVLDLIAILVILACLLLFVTFPSGTAELEHALKIGGYVAVSICLAFGFLLWTVRKRGDRLLQMVRACLSVLSRDWLNKVVHACEAFVMGLQAVTRTRGLSQVLLSSVVLWVSLALTNALTFYSFSLDLPLYAAFLCLVLQVLGAGVPSSPGFIGTYHAVVVVGLSMFDVTQEVALSMAVIMHAAFFFPFILVGLIFLWKDNISLNDLKAVRDVCMSSRQVS